jgi:hypothetical protein
MGVGPFELLHRASQRNGLVAREHREGMMGHRGRRNCEQHAGGKGGEYRLHDFSPRFLKRRYSIAPTAIIAADRL